MGIMKIFISIGLLLSNLCFAQSSGLSSYQLSLPVSALIKKTTSITFPGPGILIKLGHLYVTDTTGREVGEIEINVPNTQGGYSRLTNDAVIAGTLTLVDIQEIGGYTVLIFKSKSGNRLHFSTPRTVSGTYGWSGAATVTQFTSMLESLRITSTLDLPSEPTQF